jgi:hypothetical protein
MIKNIQLFFIGLAKDKYPKYELYTERTLRKFAWLPHRSAFGIIWLVRYEITQRYSKGLLTKKYYWQTISYRY